MIQVRRALLSVSDKGGLVDFARFLAGRGVELVSTGGTLKALREAGIPVMPVEELTGFPEMMDGRLKTLHPKIHGGLLALRDNAEHQKSMKEHGIGGIDLVIVNLYPFASTVARGAAFDEVVENIDIGGPTMLRAAAKNHRFCASVCNPADYPAIQKDIETNGGISPEMSLRLMRATFNHTASYDANIASYLNRKAGDRFPEDLTLTFHKVQPLRYGENPHQQAAFYRDPVVLAEEAAGGMHGLEQLQGKELSFNNLLDLSAAFSAAFDLPGPGLVIVKHLNPCGAALIPVGERLAKAFALAKECDPVSAFGGIIGTSTPVDEEAAALMGELFLEAVIAPDFTAGALQVFSAKKNLRVIRARNPERILGAGFEVRPVAGGVLYEDLDIRTSDRSTWNVVTKRAPGDEEWKSIELAWSVAKHVKSNAIVFAGGLATLGIGAGQMSRVDSAMLAVMKAGNNKRDLHGSAVGSDAFFPFRDGLDVLAKAGAKAVIQPGGSVRDQEVIDAANEHGMAMVFTGRRHFRH